MTLDIIKPSEVLGVYYTGFWVEGTLSSMSVNRTNSLEVLVVYDTWLHARYSPPTLHTASVLSRGKDQ